MIYGIGTDVCDIRRITATLQRRGDRFAQKVLGPPSCRFSRPGVRGRPHADWPTWPHASR
jgi:hypothetical protein